MKDAGTMHSSSAAGSFPSEDELRPEIDPETGIDLSLIDHCLSMSPWERMLANDDALNFAEELQQAMSRSHAQS